MCEDLDGNSAGEFVVKLRRGMETGVVGLTCELLSALLAADFGLRTPNPAIVDVDPAIGGLLGVCAAEKFLACERETRITEGSLF